MDPRKDYLARLAIDSLGASVSSMGWAVSADEMAASLHGSSALANFLEQPHVRTLQVSVVPSKAGAGTYELSASTAVGFSSQNGSRASSGIVFIKRSMEALTNDNMSTVVMMSTLGASPLQSLQLNVRQLYAPMLLQDPTWASKLDADARRSLEALDTALDAAMQLGEKQGAEEDVSTIGTPHDECQHWKMIDAGYMAGATSEQRARARQFWEVLQPYAEPLSNFRIVELSHSQELMTQRSPHDSHCRFPQAKSIGASSASHERSRARSSLRQTPTRHIGSTKHVGDASAEASRARGAASYARHVPSGTLVCTDSTHGRDANLVLCARAQGGTGFSAHAHGASRW
jgi:hypothetical protein